MKSINPIFFLLSSIVILFIALFSFDKAKSNLKIEVLEYQEFKELALVYNNKRIFFSDKKSITKRVQQILSSSNIKNASILQKDKKIILRITSINTTMVQKFINKILNEQFNIIKLEILKNKLTLEIGVVK